MSRKQKIVFLFLILFLAFIFRFWKLKEIPPGLYPDVALNGTEAFFSLKNKDFKVFYPENYGREGLMMWLIALSFSIFGVSVWSIKIVSATIGTLTVLGLYFLAKELFKNEKIAFLSAFFLAISFWHTLLSRIGFRVILLPFVLVFSFYFLFKALKRKKIFEAFWGGLFFGLGFYTYTSFRMVVLMLPLFLIFWLLYKKEEKKKFFQIFLLFLTTTFFVALPIGIYFLKNPGDFFQRTGSVSVFAADNPPKEIFKSFILHLGMFNFYGDPNWRHNFSRQPMLWWPIGILFLIGIYLVIKSSFEFGKNLESAITNFLLISWFFIMLLPGILTREGLPHSLRVAGVIPVVFIFSGIGGVWTIEKLRTKIENKKIISLLISLFLILCLLFEFNKYFFNWANKPEVKKEYTTDLVEIGEYLNSLPENIEKYVIVNRGGMSISWANNLPISAQPLMFLEISKYGKISSNYLLPEKIKDIKIKKEGIILLLSPDENLVKSILNIYPLANLVVKKDFWVLKVKF